MNFSTRQKATRKRIIEISFKRNLSHLGSCLSVIDLIDAVYHVKKNKEKFVLSPGHSGIALYVVLEKHGLITESQINRLNFHPDRNSKLGIDVSTGSLGQGLPIAVGFALADKSENVYCLISDGECMEGSIWEALRIARLERLTNLKILMSANGWGAYSTISSDYQYNMFKGFGYNPREVDGCDLVKIERYLKIKEKNKPLLIFARTNVEQLPFLKGLDAHYHLMNQVEYQKALKLLR